MRFGIWQWYYLNAPVAAEKCHLEGKSCQAVEDEASGGGGGADALFNMDNIKRKLSQMSESLEHTFNLPFTVLLAIAISAFAAFCGAVPPPPSSPSVPSLSGRGVGAAASALMLCMWKYGLCGGKKRKLRYSRLDEGEESKSLTELPDQLLD